MSEKLIQVESLEQLEAGMTIYFVDPNKQRLVPVTVDDIRSTAEFPIRTLYDGECWNFCLTCNEIWIDGQATPPSPSTPVRGAVVPFWPGVGR